MNEHPLDQKLEKLNRKKWRYLIPSGLHDVWDDKFNVKCFFGTGFRNMERWLIPLNFVVSSPMTKTRFFVRFFHYASITIRFQEKLCFRNGVGRKWGYTEQSAVFTRWLHGNGDGCCNPDSARGENRQSKNIGDRSGFNLWQTNEWAFFTSRVLENYLPTFAENILNSILSSQHQIQLCLLDRH